MKSEDDVFSDLLLAAPGAFALLVDSGGPVIAGSLGTSAAETRAELAAAAIEVSADAARAERHLGVGSLTAVVCEAQGGAIALARIGDSTAVAGAPAPATPARVRLVLGKVTARANSIAVRV